MSALQQTNRDSWNSGHASDAVVTIVHPNSRMQSSRLVHIEQSKHPPSITRRSASTALVAAVLVTVGSLSFRTRRESITVSARSGRVTAKSSSTDGIGQWAIHTFPLGFLAGALLMVARTRATRAASPGARRPLLAVAFALIAAGCLFAASIVAYLYWQPLLIELRSVVTTTTAKHIVTEGLAYVAIGLPIVTIAGAFGALAALAFAVAMLQTATGSRASEAALASNARDLVRNVEN